MMTTKSTEELLNENKYLKYVRTDKNGTRYFDDYLCTRCYGHGYYAIGTLNNAPVLSPYDGGECWECHGTGRGNPHTIKVYTLEYGEKLAAQKARRDAKKEQEKNERLKATYEERMTNQGWGKEEEEFVVYRIKNDTYSIKDTLKELGCKFKPELGWYSAIPLADYPYQRIIAEDVLEKTNDFSIKWKSIEKCKAIWDNDKTPTGEWIGNIGDHIVITLKIDRVITVDGNYGTSNIILMNDTNGNHFKWSTQKYYDVGTIVTFKATIKAHTEYTTKVGDTIKQTVLTRCTVFKN